jgi:hypothetical protein
MFLHGCNYPWSTDGTTIFYGLDFGANIWGSHLGVSTRRAAIRRDFDEMAALGFTVARWFVFADGRAGIVYDDRGLPSGPDPHLFADLDTALEIARDAGVRLALVLLDHRWMFEGVRDTIADPATGTLFEARLPHGRGRVLLSAHGREALLLQLFAPLVYRYGRSGARSDLADVILAYELMNEPDFIVEEWEQDVSRHVLRPLPFAALAELVSGLSDIVHSCSPAFTTIGCARLHNLWAWDDDRLGLDILQLHNYPDTRLLARNVDVFGMPASALGVTRDVILGEFPGNGPEHHPEAASPPSTTLDEYLEFALAGGYRGAWPWSFSGTDGYGTLPFEPLRRFARQHPELVHPRARHE